MTAISDGQGDNTSGPLAPERRGTLLQPSTVGIVKEALGFYIQGNLDFLDVYFPEVSRRRYVVWDDIFDLGQIQADALRPIMVESIRHFMKQAGRDRNRNLNLLTGQPEDQQFVSFHEKKARFWTEALKDLCRTYGLECPI